MASSRGYANEWKLGRLETNYQASLLDQQEGYEDYLTYKEEEEEEEEEDN
jgi:hypothetical protein